MKLADYLEQNRMTAADFATLIGVHKSSVSRWVDPDSSTGIEHRPGWDVLKKIKQVTDGQVTADDFMGDEQSTPDPHPPAAIAPRSTRTAA